MKHRTIINIFTGLALAAAVAVIALISIILTGKSHLYNAADRIVQEITVTVIKLMKLLYLTESHMYIKRSYKYSYIRNRWRR